MRAREFIFEQLNPEPSKRQRFATRGLNKFTDDDRWSSDYKLYRLGMALAKCDGVNLPDMPEESWVGRWKTLHPYSKAEQEMIKLSAKVAGVKVHDLNHGDMESSELPDTYTVSPISNWNKK
jgi:hypothetical protein